MPWRFSIMRQSQRHPPGSPSFRYPARQTAAQQLDIQLVLLEVHVVQVVISSSPRAEGLTCFAILTTSLL